MSFPIYLTREPIFHVHGLLFHGASLSQNTLRKRHPTGMTHLMIFPKVGAVSHDDVRSERDCSPSPTGCRTQASQTFPAACTLPKLFSFHVPGIFLLGFMLLTFVLFPFIVCACTPLQCSKPCFTSRPFSFPMVRTHLRIIFLAIAKHTQNKNGDLIVPRRLNVHFQPGTNLLVTLPLSLKT